MYPINSKIITFNELLNGNNLYKGYVEPSITIYIDEKDPINFFTLIKKNKKWQRFEYNTYHIEFKEKITLDYESLKKLKLREKYSEFKTIFCEIFDDLEKEVNDFNKKNFFQKMKYNKMLKLKTNKAFNNIEELKMFANNKVVELFNMSVDDFISKHTIIMQNLSQDYVMSRDCLVPEYINIHNRKMYLTSIESLYEQGIFEIYPELSSFHAGVFHDNESDDKYNAIYCTLSFKFGKNVICSSYEPSLNNEKNKIEYTIKMPRGIKLFYNKKKAIEYYKNNIKK